jgi:tRNA U34 5-carboxymethylaminomethyl modifying GTPase MnmE/TrmE
MEHHLKDVFLYIICQQFQRLAVQTIEQFQLPLHPLVPSHTINYGHIIDPESKEVVEEVMVSVLRAPKTFTREDIINFFNHFFRLWINNMTVINRM